MQKILIISCLTFVCTISRAENLLEDGGFERLTNIGNKAVWKINPAYPGKIDLIENAEMAHSGTKFIHIEATEREAGLTCTQKFPRNTGRFKISYYCRGEGKVILQLLTWGSKTWICSYGGVWRKITSTSDWTLIESKIKIPEQLTSISTKELTPVVNLEVGFFARGVMDIDDVSISEGE